jgi:adenosylhomocysteine nucleosidase
MPETAGDCVRLRPSARAKEAEIASPNPHGRVVKGIIGSAFEFNREVDRLSWIRKTDGVSSEDMESAFAAGTAAGFNTPFLAIRVISDSEFHAPDFQVIAGEYGAAFVVDLIRTRGGLVPPVR